MSEPRNDRLTIRKTNEEVLRKRLEVQARDLCDTEIKSFVECAKYQGLLVVFNCRKENYTMSQCMDRHCTEEEFQKFLIKQGFDPSQLRDRST